MADCERLAKCPFFAGKMSNMPAVAELIKLEYCYGDKTQCARYLVATAGLEVPSDLYPLDRERAEDIIRAK
jgi:hypothetical protein